MDISNISTYYLTLKIYDIEKFQILENFRKFNFKRIYFSGFLIYFFGVIQLKLHWQNLKLNMMKLNQILFMFQ